MKRQTVKKIPGLRRSVSYEQIAKFAERGEKQQSSEEAAGAARRIARTANAAIRTKKIRPFLGKKEKPADDNEYFQFSEKSMKDGALLKCAHGKIWDKSELPPRDNVYKLLRKKFKKHENTDVQILIGGIVFNCHMLVLQCCSEFFMKCGNLGRIILPEEKVTPRAFSLMYDWMLTEKPLLRRKGILQVYNAAKYLRVQQLVNQCWCCFDSEILFREDTAFILYLEARPLGLGRLKQLMLSRVFKFFLTLVSSRDFLKLYSKEVCALLSSNAIGVNAELEVFMAAVRWLSHDWKNRECLVADVVGCVRFSLMPSWILVLLNKYTGCEEISKIVSHPSVKKMINDGISFTTIHMTHKQNREEFLSFLEDYQLAEPMQRRWVYDRRCEYLQQFQYPNTECIDYDAFLEYLYIIRTKGPKRWCRLQLATGSESNQCEDEAENSVKTPPSTLECLLRHLVCCSAGEAIRIHGSERLVVMICDTRKPNTVLYRSVQ